MIDRFGITFDWRGADIHAVSSVALQADHSGCGYLWVPEAWGLEAFSSVGHLLSITRRTRIGTGIANVFSRSAATLAMGAATLNQLAPNRFMLGLGTSGRGLVQSFHGVKFESALERTNEYVQVIRKVLSGKNIEHEGKVLHNLSSFRLYTSTPSSQTPIYLGAIGKKNLELAGRIADGAIVVMYPLSKLSSCLRGLNEPTSSAQQGTEQGGKRKLFAYLPLRIANSQRELEAARAELSQMIAYYVSSMGDYYARNLARLGYGKLVEEIISRSSSPETKEGVTVPDELLMELTLIGEPHKIIERIAKLPDDIHPVFMLKAGSYAEGSDSSRVIREISLALGEQARR